jgi:hypothetical protein
LLILQKAEEEELMKVVTVVVVMTEQEEQAEDGTCTESKQRKRSMWRQRRLCWETMRERLLADMELVLRSFWWQRM